MAKVLFGGGIAAMSGSEAGRTYSRNASGAYVKNKSIPHNANTAKQQAVRSQFAGLISSWKSLSDAQQQAWIDMSPQYPSQDRLGQSVQLTGQQLYNRLNLNLANIGLAPISTPLIPKTLSSPAVSSLTMTLTAGVLTTAELGFEDVGTNTESIVISVTPGVSGGITRPTKGLFRKTLIIADASTGPDFDFSSEYLALYGSPELGGTIFARAMLVNRQSGQTLNLGQATAVVGGT